jgi:hypothetical protein
MQVVKAWLPVRSRSSSESQHPELSRCISWARFRSTSDGLAEPFDSQGCQFGYEAVADSFRIAAHADGAQGVIVHLLAAAAAFRESRPLDDDITLVAIRTTAR